MSGEVLLSAAVGGLAFTTLLFIASVLLPGKRATGPDADGGERVYCLNGFVIFLLTIFVVGFAHIFDWFSLSWVHTHFFGLFAIANLFAFSFPVWFYFQGQRRRRYPHGFLHGYFYGVDASPVWWGIDLKFFSYRPSLIGLALLNLSFAVVQYETHGEVSLAMALYQVFTFVYVLNYFQFEDGMIHTWDIISERFGWMLVWGDYVLVPFFYCLPAWFLVDTQVTLSPAAAIAITALFAFGFWLFRTANQQKHDFKHKPKALIWGRPVETLDGKLLVSGLWGIGRHLNYTGEICVYYAFALTTAFSSWIPFLLPVWLTILLLHRSVRDERRCREKYGELWDRYSQRARFSMIPFIH